MLLLSEFDPLLSFELFSPFSPSLRILLRKFWKLPRFKYCEKFVANLPFSKLLFEWLVYRMHFKPSFSFNWSIRCFFLKIVTNLSLRTWSGKKSFLSLNWWAFEHSVKTKQLKAILSRFISEQIFLGKNLKVFVWNSDWNETLCMLWYISNPCVE